MEQLSVLSLHMEKSCNASSINCGCLPLVQIIANRCQKPCDCNLKRLVLCDRSGICGPIRFRSSWSFVHLLQFWMSESCNPNKSARRILQTTLQGSLWQIDTRLFGAWNKCSHPRQTALHTWGLGCNAAFQCVAKGLAILTYHLPCHALHAC